TVFTAVRLMCLMVYTSCFHMIHLGIVLLSCSLLPLSLFLLPAPIAHSPLSLHDALPICCSFVPPTTGSASLIPAKRLRRPDLMRSEEHTSELQSRFDLVCRLLLEKKNRQARYSNS